MRSRAVFGGASVVVSLLLILLVAIARFGEQRPHPDPSKETKTAAPILAQPQVLEIPPVVLPPPPTTKAKASVTSETVAPKPAQAKLKSDPKQTKRTEAPEASPSSAATANAEPQAQQSGSEPAAEREPPKRRARDESLRPVPSAKPRPVAKTATTKQPVTASVASVEEIAQGRTLLRFLEHGSGPSIELAWPDAARQREKLFTLLGRCFGMQVALIDEQGLLYTAAGRPNAPWTLNLDRFSGFVRRPDGALSRQEQRAAARISAHHDGLRDASPVRVFPRNVDARLLGGLRRLIGESYGRARSIRARYRVSGRHLVVEQIVADGRVVPGRLELPPVAQGACGRRSRA